MRCPLATLAALLICTGCANFDWHGAAAGLADSATEDPNHTASRNYRQTISDRQTLKSLYPDRASEFDRMSGAQLAGELRAAELRGDFAPSRTNLRAP